MALWVCLDCTTAYAVGLFRCPRCHGEKFAEDGSEEAEMAKITKHGGPSNADPNTPDSAEEVPSSPGTSSPTSTAKPTTTPERSETPRRSPAPTTGNRSKKVQTGSRSAPGTDGGQTARTSATPEAKHDKDEGADKK